MRRIVGEGGGRTKVEGAEKGRGGEKRKNKEGRTRESEEDERK